MNFFENVDGPTVLFASAEVTPFSKTGGLGDVAGSLPRALHACGCNVVVATPKYRFLSDEWTRGMEYVCTLPVAFEGRVCQCVVEHLKYKGVDYLFFESEKFFDCDTCYDLGNERYFAFFSKAVCACAEALGHFVPGFSCDVIHCNDWHTALVPAYLRQLRDENAASALCGVRTVLTIHNACFQGPACDFSLDYLADLEPYAVVDAAAEPHPNYLRVGLQLADCVTTVSPNYAHELLDAEYGFGLEDCFRALAHKGRLAGILNGIDFDEWNPVHDAALDAPFSADDPSGKALCKADVQRAGGLEVVARRPLLVAIGRLYDQKGFDLIAESLPELVNQGAQVVVLATGDAGLAQRLQALADAHPQSVCFMDRFDEDMAHRLYAAGDIFLMPSRFEPCGLAQLIAMRYGAVPVVHDTGGLHDTVQAFDAASDTGTGFVFAEVDAESLLHCVSEALRVYEQEPEAWTALRMRAMRMGYNWKRSALEYKELYTRL